MSGALDAILAEAARGGRPDGIVLMRLLGEAATEDEARDALARAIACRAAAADTQGSMRLDRLRQLWAAHPQAWAVVRETLALAAHDRTATTPDATLLYWTQVFDRLAAGAPEAGVALYALGSPALLAQATREIVDHLDALGLVGSASDVLDLGCGIGRLAAALAPRVRGVLGLDISAGMVAEACRRHGDLGNVAFRQGNGRDLADVADESHDLVLAADVFPYLVQAGGGLAAAHIRAFARILRPGGAALILNFSYRGDLEADRRDVAEAAGAAGLRVARNGSIDLSLWDAAGFLLQRG